MKSYEVLEAKLEKVERLLDELIDGEDGTIQDKKLYKKYTSKRNQYIQQLEEYERQAAEEAEAEAERRRQQMTASNGGASSEEESMELEDLMEGMDDTDHDDHDDYDDHDDEGGDHHHDNDSDIDTDADANSNNDRKGRNGRNGDHDNGRQRADDESSFESEIYETDHGDYHEDTEEYMVDLVHDETEGNDAADDDDDDDTRLGDTHDDEDVEDEDEDEMVEELNHSADDPDSSDEKMASHRNARRPPDANNRLTLDSNASFNLSTHSFDTFPTMSSNSSPLTEAFFAEQGFDSAEQFYTKHSKKYNHVTKLIQDMINEHGQIDAQMEVPVKPKILKEFQKLARKQAKYEDLLLRTEDFLEAQENDDIDNAGHSVDPSRHNGKRNVNGNGNDTDSDRESDYDSHQDQHDRRTQYQQQHRQRTNEDDHPHEISIRSISHSQANEADNGAPSSSRSMQRRHVSNNSNKATKAKLKRQMTPEQIKTYRKKYEKVQKLIAELEKSNKTRSKEYKQYCIKRKEYESILHNAATANDDFDNGSENDDIDDNVEHRNTPIDRYAMNGSSNVAKQSQHQPDDNHDDDDHDEQRHQQLVQSKEYITYQKKHEKVQHLIAKMEKTRQTNSREYRKYCLKRKEYESMLNKLEAEQSRSTTRKSSAAPSDKVTGTPTIANRKAMQSPISPLPSASQSSPRSKSSRSPKNHRPPNTISITSPSTGSFTAPSKPASTPKKPKHSKDILQKKLAKCHKQLKSCSASDYKKIQLKIKQYKDEIQWYENDNDSRNDDDDDDDDMNQLQQHLQKHHSQRSLLNPEQSNGHSPNRPNTNANAHTEVRGQAQTSQTPFQKRNGRNEQNEKEDADDDYVATQYAPYLGETIQYKPHSTRSLNDDSTLLSPTESVIRHKLASRQKEALRNTDTNSKTPNTKAITTASHTATSITSSSSSKHNNSSSNNSAANPRNPDILQPPKRSTGEAAVVQTISPEVERPTEQFDAQKANYQQTLILLQKKLSKVDKLMKQMEKSATMNRKKFNSYQTKRDEYMERILECEQWLEENEELEKEAKRMLALAEQGEIVQNRLNLGDAMMDDCKGSHEHEYDDDCHDDGQYDDDESYCDEEERSAEEHKSIPHVHQSKSMPTSKKPQYRPHYGNDISHSNNGDDDDGIDDHAGTPVKPFSFSTIASETLSPLHQAHKIEILPGLPDIDDEDEETEYDDVHETKNSTTSIQQPKHSLPMLEKKLKKVEKLLKKEGMKPKERRKLQIKRKEYESQIDAVLQLQEEHEHGMLDDNDGNSGYDEKQDQAAARAHHTNGDPAVQREDEVEIDSDEDEDEVEVEDGAEFYEEEDDVVLDSGDESIVEMTERTIEDDYDEVEIIDARSSSSSSSSASSSSSSSASSSSSSLSSSSASSNSTGIGFELANPQDVIGAPASIPAAAAGLGTDDSKSQPQPMQARADIRTATPRDQLREQACQSKSKVTKKLLDELNSIEKLQEKMKQQLAQNGIPVTDEIPYEVAKSKIESIQREMRSMLEDPNQMQQQKSKYYGLEEQLTKYSTAMMMTEEWAEEQERLELEWEASNEDDNNAALRAVRQSIPVNVRNMSEEMLTTQASPASKTLPKAYAKRLKRVNVLQLLRVDPVAIERMHPSLLEGLRTTGLTLTERRALHQHLKSTAEIWESKKIDKSQEKRFLWFQSLKQKFREMLNAYKSHVEKHGAAGSHGKCGMIGNQCPVKADSAVDYYSEDYGHPTGAQYEHMEAAYASSPVAAKGGIHAVGRNKLYSATKKQKSKMSMSSPSPNKVQLTEEDLQDQVLHRLRIDENRKLSAVDKDLLVEIVTENRRSKSLEKQLTLAGLKVADDSITYEVAKQKIFELREELQVVATDMSLDNSPKEQAKLETEYVRLADDLDRYQNALVLTPEWASEQQTKNDTWEMSIAEGNREALRQIRRHMPVNIRELSVNDVCGPKVKRKQRLPELMVRKWKRTTVLMMLRVDPDVIAKMHPSSLEGLSSTGLTLTERRALHEHLHCISTEWKRHKNDPMADRKWMWFDSLKSKFKETLEEYDAHIAKYGPPGEHLGGCPLIGTQCPLKANLKMDYSGDYGYPDGDEYETMEVEKHNLLSVEEYEQRKSEGFKT